MPDDRGICRQAASCNANGLNLNRAQITTQLALPASGRDRKLTILLADGEGTEVIKRDVGIPAGQKV